MLTYAERSAEVTAVNPQHPCLLRSRPAAAAQVTNKEGALFQLPQLLTSMRLVPQQDISRHLVVVTYSAPAQVRAVL